MKRLLLVLIIPLMVGCSAFGTFRQLSDSAGDRLQAYALGRSSYYVVNKLSEDTVKAMEDDYNAFLARTEGTVLVEPDQVVEFISGQTKIIASEADDPHGFIGDLLKILGMYGAEYDVATGEIAVMYPIPRSLFWEYSDGYKWSKLIEGRNQ